ncbi:MAG: exodeoxyribonuclease VII large subunit, partial [candidate division Zixibacteria bacterium]|nr:exodeoxyribonuclease VII large subunit [candidate division Zixibacteria bacterium]
MPDKIYTVSEITKQIKELLEEQLPTVWIEGEISNFILHSSGHRYFSLKDQEAQIRCVLWRGRSEGLDFEPQSGMNVLALGKISVYEKRGEYQLYVEVLRPLGIGKLELELQRLKEKLQKEGLFDEEHKKPIPKFPETIGIVTSPTGAAIRDIIKIIQRRAPYIKLILNPVRVQGEGAENEISQAIAQFNRYKKVDLIIVGRGGGSLEDLWAFNEEIVARAIFKSKIPIISAVGHEIDFTISDLVADLRAATPSVAAEMVVRDKKELERELSSLAGRIINCQNSILEYNKNRLGSIQRSYGFRKPLDLLNQKMQRTDEVWRAFLSVIKNYFELKKKGLSSFFSHLNALSPLAILERGYSITRKVPELSVVKDA